MIKRDRAMNFKRLMKIKDDASNKWIERLKTTPYNAVTADMVKKSGIMDIVLEYFPKASLYEDFRGSAEISLGVDSDPYFYDIYRDFYKKLNALGVPFYVDNIHNNGKEYMIVGTEE